MLKKFLLPVFLMLAASLSADTLIPDWLIAEYDKKDALFDVFYIHPTLLKDKKNPFPDFGKGFLLCIQIIFYRKGT